MAGAAMKKTAIFQSTQPKRAATTMLQLGHLTMFTFQSTQPKRAATVQKFYKTLPPIFQSTQPKRAATRKVYAK